MDEGGRDVPRTESSSVPLGSAPEDAATGHDRQAGGGQGPDTVEGAAAVPAIDSPSVVLKLASGGDPDAGVDLRDLEEEPPLPPLKLGPGKYRVLRLLGEGGMGKVYLAYDQDLRRRVALKMMRPVGPRAAQRFLEEAQVMAQLQHPNIVPLFEIGLADGERKPYYTMPVVQGRTLAEVIDRLRVKDPEALQSYSLARRLQVFVQVAQAVGYAHAKGVAHLDLKPANVMLGGHGEVQVMDWGLAHVFAARGIETASGRSTLPVARVGTPGYMSPEQVLGEDVGFESDIWALGVILYELLCLERPFEGSRVSLLAGAVSHEPVPPRQRSRDLEVPVEMERACQKALRKDRHERPRSAEELAASVRDWLEAEADRAKRHERAELKAREGRAHLDTYLRTKDEASALAEEAKSAASRFESWRPVAEKQELVLAHERARQARLALSRSASETLASLGDALAFEEDNATARECLADYYMGRLRDAEEERDEEQLAFVRDLVAKYHDGKYTRELVGDGTLELRSHPAGALVSICTLEEEGFEVVRRAERPLGTTPLGPLPLAMGSYLVLLRKEGFRDTLYPVHVTRNRAWEGHVRLFRDEEIGRGMIHVAAGPFVMGGDPMALDHQLARSEPWVADFFIAEFPVTLGEYLDFLKALAAEHGIEAARERGPRPSHEAPTYLIEDEKGELRLPEIDGDGDRWDTSMPACGISFADASAYCAWLSRRESVTYRLPSEIEWEKAARGVDGRWFPWGWRFDPSLCNMRESLPGRPTVMPVHSFPSDVSVYGVRGMAGNMRTPTTTTVLSAGMGASARETRVAKGGCWSYPPMLSRCAARTQISPNATTFQLGIRLARSPEGGAA